MIQVTLSGAASAASIDLKLEYRHSDGANVGGRGGQRWVHGRPSTWSGALWRLHSLPWLTDELHAARPEQLAAVHSTVSGYVAGETSVRSVMDL